VPDRALYVADDLTTGDQQDDRVFVRLPGGRFRVIDGNGRRGFLRRRPHRSARNCRSRSARPAGYGAAFHQGLVSLSDGNSRLLWEQPDSSR
jgi:hypothetical protein